MALTFAFLPIRNRAQDYIDKLFFKNKYEYHQTLKSLSRISTTVIRLDELAELVINKVAEVVKIDSASILAVNQATGAYEMVHSKKGG